MTMAKRSSKVVAPEPKGIEGRTDVRLSDDTRKRMALAREAGQPEPGLITIEFRSEVTFPDKGDVTIKGSIFGSNEGAWVAAHGIHDTFTEGNHAFALMREHHRAELDKHRQKVEALEQEIKDLRAARNMDGDDGSG
jgi:hypothetical protein